MSQLGIAVPPSQGNETLRRGNAPPPPPRGTGQLDQIKARGVHFAVWNSDGSLQTGTTDLLKPERVSEGDSMLMRTAGETRQAIHFTGAGRCFLVGRSIAVEQRELRQLGWYLTAAGTGVLVLGLLGGWWMASRAIRPIAIISEDGGKDRHG